MSTAASSPPSATTLPRPARGRIVGVDLARGVALVGMMAVHVLDVVGDDGDPTATGLLASGRSAALFAVLAGISLAFLSGGRRVVQGSERQAVRWGLLARAALIGAIGLLLGLTDVTEVILLFYALMFVVAIPLLAAPPRVLVALAATLVAAGPVLLLMLARGGVEFGVRADPTPVTVLTEPIGVLGSSSSPGRIRSCCTWRSSAWAWSSADWTSGRAGWRGSWWRVG